MKVLLCGDVKKLGWLGDIVEVSEGYARNYLLPQGRAVVATEANIRAIAREKAGRAEQRIRERGRLEEAAKAVAGAEAVIAAKANEEGNLFGSIVGRQIAANLRSQGFEVADEIVQLPEHIKCVGTHEVTLKFADDLTAEVKVVVVPEPPQLLAKQEWGSDQSPRFAKGRSTPDIAGSATAGEGEPNGT
jgi:large subunit ribosomal protein L9